MTQHTSTIKSAIVIGGGIAGPVTAMALIKAGIKADVYEAYPGPTFGIGSGLALAPNGMAALDLIGVGDSVRAIADPMSASGLSIGGKLVTTPVPAGLPPLQMVDRNQLHQVLHDHAARAGVPVTYEKRLVSVTEDPASITAHFADGSSATAEVLIGADGVRSIVRGLIDPANPGPDYTGMLGFGATIDNSLGLTPSTLTFSFGKRAYYLYGALDDHRIIWAANLAHRDYLSWTEARKTPAERWLQILRETYADDDLGAELARLTTPAQLETQGALHIMPPVPRWWRGRMVLVGDAVHAPSNSSGQGASLSIENAIQLARCLRDLGDPAEAFSSYEGLRRARVEAVAARARKLNHTKTPGPIGRLMMSWLVPMMIKRSDPETALGVEQRYRIDWDAPVRSALVDSKA